MLPDLSGIHYSDALLSALFAGGFFFMGYSLHRFSKIDAALAKFDKRLTKKLLKANMKGAKIVNAKFDELKLLINNGRTHQ